MTSILLPGYCSISSWAARQAELYVPEIPVDRVRCSTSFPASSMGRQKASYSPMLTWEVVETEPFAILS